LFCGNRLSKTLGPTKKCWYESSNPLQFLPEKVDFMSMARIVEITQMESDALGLYVEEAMQGVCLKLVELKPYIEELWRRFDAGEVIRCCENKKQFCETILHRTPQTVRRMLSAGNPIKKEGETPPQPDITAEELHTVEKLREWIKTHCPEVFAFVQPTVYGVIARTAGLRTDGGYDLHIHSVTPEQIKVACLSLRVPRDPNVL
jgi:hypothetical protein